MTYAGTKISLVKKSGPGELIGITELLIDNTDSVSFEGLQFSDPGTYVISILSDKKDVIEDGEFTITVQKEDEIIEQPKPAAQEDKPTETSGDRPCIAQIDQPSYKLPPMVLTKPEGEQATNETTTTIGINPFFYYNGIQMEQSDIRSLNLFYDGLIPKVTISFRDGRNVLKKYPPLDDTRFEIFLNSQSANIKSIHLRFKYETHNQEAKAGVYTITGVIDIPMLYTVSSKSYSGTSFEVLRKLAKEMELGFNSNIQNTTDSMNWINTNKKISEYIKDVVMHSYISDESFMRAYIDFYYCLNFVDVEKEWKRDISNDKGINSNASDRILAGKSESDRVEPIALTNELGSAKSGNLITKFSFSNNSTYQSLKKGYSTDVKYYDPKTKQFLEFKVDSLTSDGKNNVILKGQPGDSKYFEENYITDYKGKIDDDNVHKNYNYAAVQNQVNLDNLVRIYCDLTMKTPNYNLYKYQKVKILFVNQTQTPIASEASMQRYSGEWQIVEISYLWQGGKMSQQIRAVRKELSKTEEEKANQQQEQKPETKEQAHTNPDPEAPKPNSEYNIGDIYTVTDPSGNTYEIMVTDILANGNEIGGTLKRI